MQFQEIAEEIKKIRKKEFARIAEKRKSKLEPRTRSWSEEDYLENAGRVRAKVIIMPTKACSWAWKSGCAMCGYSYEYSEKSDAELLNEFKEELKSGENIESHDYAYLKIFNSGSFLDDREVSEKLRSAIIKEVNKLAIKRLQIESRPEFVNENKIKKILKELRSDIELEIGIGLETSNDFIRKLINKGFSFADFKRACEICREHGIIVKAYLLFKPPFLREIEAIEDCINSALDAEKAGARRISVNPMNIQKATLVEKLWEKSEYTLPWLWSIAYALKEIKKKSRATIICMPTAAGKKRGAHNKCYEKNNCNDKLIKAIKEFSLTQDLLHLNKIFAEEKCSCYDEWQDFLYSEI